MLLAILGVGLALWGFGLWRRGFFGPETPPVERQAYAVRNALWLVSILIVSWPLQFYRASIGNIAYVVAALVILALFFWFGLVAANFFVKRSQARRDGA